MRTRVGWSVAYPPGHGDGSRIPVVVTMPGRGGDHRTAFDQLHLDEVLDRLRPAAGFAIASVDGGDHSYWHARSDGTDAAAMLADEFLPLLRRRGLRTGVLGLHGWSMGGYGALLLAGKDRLPVRAVAVSSPALFTSAGSTAAGAFDDAEDFDTHDVYGHPEWLDRVPSIRIDCGEQDPFYRATRDFAGRLKARPAGGFTRGGHDASFWRRVAPAQLRFLGDQLTRG
ncbi:MAG TPA: alpha/beta hydrolase-fold protein [Marmoricola sp.]|nr:alpha/beta hydrolase-fold protein [Marmoricola sp.]